MMVELEDDDTQLAEANQPPTGEQKIKTYLKKKGYLINISFCGFFLFSLAITIFTPYAIQNVLPSIDFYDSRSGSICGWRLGMHGTGIYVVFTLFLFWFSLLRIRYKFFISIFFNINCLTSVF